MRILRHLLIVGAATVTLVCPRAYCADPTPTPPTVVPQDRDDRDLLRDLRGAPDNVKTLIVNFDQVADKYLEHQRMLLLKLKNATTDAERAALREQLQDNRQAFLTQLKSFREELRTDLVALKGTLNHAELRRILDAARDATEHTSPRHKGKR